ncbi:capsule biosynthesis protein [Allorhizobium pseudoryzae]|uniref:capsule biosynthesis protein n=1 Tax=Allorhizobium pseudoryzae TaxID=379684 RepID=UPI003D006734
MTNAPIQDVDAEEIKVDVRPERERKGWLRRSNPSGSPAVIDAEDLTTSIGGEAQTETGGKPPWMLISFLLLVILPTIIGGVYFAFFASDQYTAEARFAVRSLADDGSGDGGDMNLMQMQAAPQDAYVVTSFIHSNEILSRLDGKVDYRAIFTNPEADYWSRFGADDSNEEFLKYWNKQVTSYIDGPSGIVTLSVRTFRPADSVELVSAILAESEKLVNEMTVRAREDMLASFRREVDRTGKLYQDALGRLNSFQQQSGLLSPELQAQETGKLLTGLLAQKLTLESRLFVLQQSNGTDAPSYNQLLLARESLDKQISTMRAQLTGGGNASLANVITDYSKVETDRLVAEKLYEASRRNYDLAFASAMRKALYLTVFVQPSMPEEALYPKRISTPLFIFLGLLISWATLALIWASVEDHRL